jgi:hypothetical protein
MYCLQKETCSKQGQFLYNAKLRKVDFFKIKMLTYIVKIAGLFLFKKPEDLFNTLGARHLIGITDDVEANLDKFW